MTRADFKKLALTRLADAKSLLRSRRHGAAYYVAGYAIECALKASLARKTGRYEFPPEPNEVREFYYTHKLQKLAQRSGLASKLEGGSTRLRTYWTIVKDWNEDSRYDPDAGKKARDIVKAIDDPADGVLECIKRYW
jgi:HEPN domain-containing protein